MEGHQVHTAELQLALLLLLQHGRWQTRPLQLTNRALCKTQYFSRLRYLAIHLHHLQYTSRQLMGKNSHYNKPMVTRINGSSRCLVACSKYTLRPFKHRASLVARHQ